MKLEGMLKVYCHDVEANKPGDTEFIQFTQTWTQDPSAH